MIDQLSNYTGACLPCYSKKLYGCLTGTEDPATPIQIKTYNLTDGATYYALITSGSGEKVYTVTNEAATDGDQVTLDVDVSSLPEMFFNPHANPFHIVVVNEDFEVVPLAFVSGENPTTYDCIEAIMVESDTTRLIID